MGKIDREALRQIAEQLPAHDDHAAAGGELCHDENDDGCCDTCGVLLDTCLACGGLGYHRTNCIHSEEKA